MAMGFRRTSGCESALLIALVYSVCVTGCKSGSGQYAPTQAAATASTVPGAVSPNQAPSISGSPGSAITAGQTYTFVPVATDADGDTLGFTIENRPSWTTFDTSTGRLTGTPTESNVGAFANIRISVSDGKTTASLAAFSLSVSGTAVVAPAPVAGKGAATLSWIAPTENIDGSPLTDLVGYRVRYGTTEGELTQEIAISSADVTTYTVSDLLPATYFFAIKAVSASGVESSLSGIASKTIT